MPSPKDKKRYQVNKEAVENLFKLLPRLKNLDDAQEFLQDLFSGTEIKEISRRLFCAQLLYENETYLAIEDLLGMSPVTINKIHAKTRGSKVLPKLFS